MIELNSRVVHVLGVSAKELPGPESTVIYTRAAPPHDLRAPARLTPADLEALQFPGATVYICGSSPFADAATDATRALGIPDGRVRVERFGQTG